MDKSIENKSEWTEVIKPQVSLFDLHLKEVWRYRDLLSLLVRRDFVSNFKQTILGPLWFFIQPLMTTIIFTIVFGNIAGLAPAGIPTLLFYLSGITMWSYFSECLTKTSTVFRDNASIFGKVYFPRLIMPLSIIVSNLLRMGVQLVLFLCFWLYYYFSDSSIEPNWAMALFPLLIVLMAGMGLGLGLIISALTNKYRDLSFLLTFAVQLMMYATPVITPLSKVSGKYLWILKINPMTSIIETFRYGFLGSKSAVLDYGMLGYSALFTVVVVVVGAIIFNKVEKTFMDTV
ncbi:ABC transporter permease [Taibaiella sp. KBW10]|uniref:ABC transporter permease n=1 Tax=Taibaiella sp. KBW10 TaxID=2153357 RepID=UPI000F5B060F|nr:ABC transporter permease [Taibaiella sp. KBW10]RQO31942.1 ABC transporter permease [Taibaiella sp. KBW10]